MRSAYAGLIVLAAMPSDATAFDIDLTPQDFVAKAYEFVLQSAAVRDVVRLHTDFLCHRDGRLHVPAATPLVDAQGLHWRATVEPNQSLSLELMHNAAPADADALLGEIETVLLWQHCDDYRFTAGTFGSTSFTVSAVNGATSLSAMIEEQP